MTFQLGDRVIWNRTPPVEATIVGMSVPTDNSILLGWKTKEETVSGHCWDITLPNLVSTANQYIPDIMSKFRYAYWVVISEITKMSSVGQTQTQAVVSGLNCSRCRNYFPFAEPNQTDKTFVCWSCKRYPFYK